MAESDNEHQDLMKRHRERRRIEFIPWHERRSDGRINTTEDLGIVTMRMEVAGLGTLVLSAEGEFSQLLGEMVWNRRTPVKAHLEEL